MLSIRRSQPAWNSECEVVLCGDDPDHLTAVAEAAFAEIHRWERKLSIANPGTDFNRINRQASREEVSIDQELVDLLQYCLTGWKVTGGWFDVTARKLTDALLTESVALIAPAREPFLVNPTRRTVRFFHPDTSLDLSGIGRGYALDRTAELIRRYGISNAQVQIGPGTHISMGKNDLGQPWELVMPDPFHEKPRQELTTVTPRDQGAAWTATFRPSPESSQSPNSTADSGCFEPTACLVLAPSAADAMVWSTANLAMGETRWKKYSDQWKDRGLFVGWVNQVANQRRLQWLTSPPVPG